MQEGPRDEATRHGQHRSRPHRRTHQFGGVGRGGL